ncbi:MAG TPA: MurT ligase domain-containing protein [Chloroflexota bacterium]|nr:MurT ligase domain-containing protein [Chloroflexota bacterium]
MMRPRLSAALFAGRAAATLSRRLGRGGGTVIAGHLVPRLAPTALRDVTCSLQHGSIVVSGTNGKTTTTRLISHILRSAGLRPLHNRAGANLLSGLFTTIAQGSDWRGRPRGDVGVFEVDEATVPPVLRHVTPRVLLLHNIFRDQLDRYGEVHYVANLWRDAAARLPSSSTVLLNADDPLVASMHDGKIGASVLTYGLADHSVGTGIVPHASDARLCPRCGAPLRYDVSFYGHLGWYTCSRGDFARPQPAIAATGVELRGDQGTDLTLATSSGPIRARLHLPGLYNVYNALAAVAACSTLGVRREAIARGLDTFTAAFGRVERIEVEDRQLFLALVKNPVGFTEVLRTILSSPGRRTLMIAINDLFADGTDVSWLWDVEFELLQGRVNVAVCSGIRAEDMAVRLKYAGVEPERIRVDNDLRRATELALAAAEPNETVYLLPTYTAMLAVRDLLRQTGYVRGFWED